MQLAQERYQWRALALAMLNIMVIIPESYVHICLYCVLTRRPSVKNYISIRDIQVYTDQTVCCYCAIHLPNDIWAQ